MEGHVKYMLLICRDEQVWDKLSLAERQKIYADTVKLQKELPGLEYRPSRSGILNSES